MFNKRRQTALRVFTCKFKGFLRGHGSSVDSWDWEPHLRSRPQVMVTWSALRSSPRSRYEAKLIILQANNMDAAVAGKRKHFDTDEDASNRKVISSLTSVQNLIPSN